MKSDANKGINGITYNHLNLPEQVNINGNGNVGNIVYIYDAMGAKLKKITTEGSSVTETNYANGFIYEGPTNSVLLQFFSQPEGYIKVDNAEYGYVYQYDDHLGNVRLSYTDVNQNNADPVDLDIVEENNYYPFGLEHKGYNGFVSTGGSDAAQRWKFGGKEYQQDMDLNWYDVTARNYDPALGRWMNVDPLAEQMRRFSPYNYAFDNPIYFIDADGMAPNESEATDGYGTVSETSSSYWSSGSGPFLTNLITGKSISVSVEDAKSFILADAKKESKRGNSRNSISSYCPDCDDKNVLINSVRQAAAEHGANMANEYLANWTKHGGEFNKNEFSQADSYKLEKPIPLGGDFSYLEEDEYYKFYNADIVITRDGTVVSSDISFLIGQKDGSAGDYNIGRVQLMVHAPNQSGGNHEEGKIRFLNSKGSTIANLNIQSEAQAIAFWRTNFTNIRNTMIISTLQAYDRDNGTNYGDKIKGSSWSIIE